MLPSPTGSWLWLFGLWLLLLVSGFLVLAYYPYFAFLVVFTLAVAPLPPAFWFWRKHVQLSDQLRTARTETELFKQQLETVRHRVGRLREELRAANDQARLSHQLTLLGQFTAGFLHEYNNPLAIVINRIEILQDERKDDAALCTDLAQMLVEARYMSKIAQTLLHALHRERGTEAFAPSVPAAVMRQASEALASQAAVEGVQILLETPDVPRVDVPEHTVIEVVRTLTVNAIAALKGRENGIVSLRLDPYRTAGARVILRVEDNGPGVPDSLREHLFEPFASQSSGKECVGLGLFLAASLLDAYDGTLRYEPRKEGGACFVVEMPPARFTRDKPFHWFVKGDSV